MKNGVDLENTTSSNDSGFNDSSVDNLLTIQGSSLYIVTVGLICILGTGGNLVVLLSFFKEKKLRRVSNGLLGHLSLVDMLNCCIVLPWHLAITSGLSPVWSCRLWNQTSALLPSLSMHTQCLVSMNRYFLVTKSVDVYTKWFNKKTIIIAVTSLWVFDAGTFIIVYFLSSNSNSAKVDYCNSAADTERLKYYVLSFSAIASFGTAFVFYGKLIAFVRKNSMALNAVKRADSKASMTLLALLILFSLSFVISPLLLFLNRVYIDPNSRYSILAEMSLCVLFVSYCVNPIFYGLKIKLFNQTYKRLLCPCIDPQRRVLPQTSGNSTNNSNNPSRQSNQTEVSRSPKTESRTQNNILAVTERF